MTARLHALLDELERVLIEMTSPEDVARCLGPGAMAQELADAEERLGHPLSAEARTLYGWHNGIMGSIRYIPFSPYVKPLASALSSTLSSRPDLIGEVVETAYTDCQVGWAQATYFADMGGNPHWWLTHGEEVSRVVSIEGLEQGPSMPSIADLIQMQLDSLASGIWSQDDEGLWRTTLAQLTSEQRVFTWLVA